MENKFTNFGLFSANSKKTETQETTPDSTVDQARRQMIESIEVRLNEQRTISERFADSLVRWFGSMWFVFLNLFAFVAWIILNMNIIPGVNSFDDFPYILLTMIVSLEAIFLSIFVLMSQNRESRISDLREEIDLQINMIAEQEITKIIRLLSYLLKHMNVPYERDQELKRMMKPLDTEEIRRELERQLNLPRQK